MTRRCCTMMWQARCQLLMDDLEFAAAGELAARDAIATRVQSYAERAEAMLGLEHMIDGLWLVQTFGDPIWLTAPLDWAEGMSHRDHLFH